MAGGVNKAMILGRLGADPEVRFTAGNNPVCNFRMATNEFWTDKNGEKKERTEWHRIVVWGKQAEACGQYLKKGREAFVEGRIQTREWTNKEGVKQYTTEIVASHVVFVGSGRGEGAQGSAMNGQNRGADDFGPPPPGFDDGAHAGPPPGMNGGNGNAGGGEDDIPF